MDNNTTTQLHLIRELRDALGAADISWWLFGGWALDFHAGEITRPHSDIEIFIWAEDAELVRAVLVPLGFLAPAPLHPDEAQPFLKDGQEVGLWFLIQDEAGRTCTPVRWRDWPWAPGAFDGDRLTLDAITAPAMSLEGVLDMKTNFAAHPHGAPLREKDIADIVLLRDLIARRNSGEPTPA